MVHILQSEWTQVQAHILDLQAQGIVTHTFRRLNPARQQVILAAILEEAVKKGPAAINIKQVAVRANVAIGSLYQYFNNREGLLEFSTNLCVKLLTDSFSQFRSTLSALPLREALHYYLTGGMEWGQTLTGLIQFLGRAAYQGDPLLAEKVVRPVANAMRETIHEILLSAQKRGELRPDLDLEATTRTINAWMIALGDSQLLPYLNTYLQVTSEDITFDRCLASTIDILVCGLSPGSLAHPSSSNPHKAPES
jgi:AcrR family transcriptional regulator